MMNVKEVLTFLAKNGCAAADHGLMLLSKGATVIRRDETSFLFDSNGDSVLIFCGYVPDYPDALSGERISDEIYVDLETKTSFYAPCFNGDWIGFSITVPGIYARRIVKSVPRGLRRLPDAELYFDANGTYYGTSIMENPVLRFSPIYFCYQAAAWAKQPVERKEVRNES